MTVGKGRPHRRRVLTLAAGLVGGVSAPAIIGAAAPITWKMATAWPKDARGVAASASRLAAAIGTMSGGRLVVQSFAAGELVMPADLFDAVTAGTVELGHGSSAAWRDRDPAFDFFSGVPFGLLGHEHAGWLRFGGGQRLWERAYEPFGIVPLLAGSFGILAAGWFRHALSDVDALSGMPMRASGLSGEVWRRLGVKVVDLARDDILPALKTGTIDAAEWLGPWSDHALDLSTVARNYYLPGFAGPGRTIELIVNRAAYDALPDDLQGVVRAAAASEVVETGADFAFNDIATLDPLIEAGVAVRALPDAIVRAAGVEAEAMLKEIAATSPVAGETYDSFVAFRTGALSFAARGDREALRTRALAIGG
jgi:TRAP-type mannitol/chloroaromatic compound transport system substrate-binding protein